MNQNRYDVVIVGGGPAGLTAARVLGEAGATVLVIEKDRHIAELVRTSGGTWIQDMADHGVPAGPTSSNRRWAKQRNRSRLCSHGLANSTSAFGALSLPYAASTASAASIGSPR